MQLTAHNAANICKLYLGDGKTFSAVTADNTGNMKTMFAELSKSFPWLLMLGCCIHILDLLIEDIAKIAEIAKAAADVHFVVAFAKRYPLIHEWLLEQQKKLKIPALRLFPTTRFAYVYLMAHRETRNAALLSSVVDTTVHKQVKLAMARRGRHGKSKLKEFERFEELTDSRWAFD
jgi:hypothetical protein